MSLRRRPAGRRTSAGRREAARSSSRWPRAASAAGRRRRHTVDQQLETVLQAGADRRRAEQVARRRRARSPAADRRERGRSRRCPSGGVVDVEVRPHRGGRSMNSATAACDVIAAADAASGGGRSSGGTGQANSPETPSARRLVARPARSRRRVAIADAAGPLQSPRARTCPAHQEHVCGTPAFRRSNRRGSSPGATPLRRPLPRPPGPGQGRRSG